MSIENLHLHANDLHALVRMAEIDPDLANKIVDQRDKEDERFHVSHRFGIVAVVFLLLMLLAAFTFMLIYAGPIGTVVSSCAILALGLLIRVILTGEWSETSWFGRLLKYLSKALGSVSNDDQGSNSERQPK